MGRAPLIDDAATRLAQLAEHGTAVERFRRGFGYPFRGLAYLARHPRLWAYVAIPVALTIAMLVGAAVLSFGVLPSYIGGRIAPPDHRVLASLWFGLLVVLALVAFVVSAIVLYFTSGLVAIPFNELLSERVEATHLGRVDEPWDLTRMAGDVFMSVRHSIAALLLWAAVMLPLLLLNLMPVVGEVAYVALWLPITSFFLAREMLDSPLSRRRMGFADKLRLLRAHLPLMLGLGACTLALLTVPLLNFVSLPASIAGGTLLYCHMTAAGLIPPVGGR